MAEGLVNYFLRDAWEAFSAGMEATSIHPMAIEVLREIDIDISSQHSKPLDEVSSLEFDLVVILCSDAEVTCPLYLGTGKRIHIGFEDPSTRVGTEEEVAEAFRRIRDQIKERILSFLESYQGDVSPGNLSLNMSPPVQDDQGKQ